MRNEKVNWRDLAMDDDAPAIELVIMVRGLQDTGDHGRQVTMPRIGSC
jgi:hypothetical protein